MADTPNIEPAPAPAPQADGANGDIQMEFHKPKPVRSWRELLTEIGIIMIGVLLALGGEQTVEAIHWQHKVDAAAQAMLLE
jgi:hypothetical protein